jgi:type I restriction enzyme S subunit
MITTIAKFSAIASDIFMRCDVKYHQIESACNYNIFGIPANAQILLSDILREDYLKFNYEDGKEYKGIPTGQSYIDEDGDIIDYQPVTLDDHPDRLKYALTNDHILISSLRLAKSPALMFDTLDLNEYVFSNGFYSFAVSNDWNKKYVLYLLRTKALKSIIDRNIYRGIGISSYKVKDLLRIPVRNISKSEQEHTIKKIEPIEAKIASLKRSKCSIQETIDFVFQREFGFDYDKFETLKSQKYYFTQQSMFSNNPDLRFSVKYHRPAGDFVMEELIRISDKKIKHFISEPIVLGASISPSDFDESGEAYYVSMATIKTLEVVLDETQLVSSSYFEAKKAKSLQRNDIVVARSGVAIGKTAIVRDDFDGIFADFTMRIRFDEAKYNPQFAYYYLRSKYFQYLIEVYKKGLQNQNIFPIVMQEFPIPDISLPEQQRIVDEIQAEIGNQEQLKAEIASLRNQIDEVIIQSISA